MENITNNSAFHFILEKIWNNLDNQTLVNVRGTCKKWNFMIKNPEFWFKKIEKDGIFLSKHFYSVKLCEACLNQLPSKIFFSISYKIMSKPNFDYFQSQKMYQNLWILWSKSLKVIGNIF